jgi:hypothetical protein
VVPGHRAREHSLHRFVDEVDDDQRAQVGVRGRAGGGGRCGVDVAQHGIWSHPGRVSGPGRAKSGCWGGAEFERSGRSGEPTFSSVWDVLDFFLKTDQEEGRSLRLLTFLTFT